MDCKATTPISMKKKPLSKYTLNQLNKIAKKGGIVLIEYQGNQYTLDYFAQLDIGDDYYDSEEKEEGFSGINAYVQETPHRYPYECIDKIYIATEIEIK